MGIIKRAQAKTSSDYVYIRIREKIITTFLKPGEKISEKALAEEFAISRTPIREALMRLHHDGFVEVFAQRGTYVTPIHKETVMAAHYTRSVLECALIQDAAKVCTDDDLFTLRKNLAEQKHVFEYKEYSKIEILDEEFHEKIAVIAGYPAVWGIIYHVRLHINRVRMLFLEKSRIPSIIKEHEAIIDALAQRNPQNALQAMQAHLHYMEENLERLTTLYSEYR